MIIYKNGLTLASRNVQTNELLKKKKHTKKTYFYALGFSDTSIPISQQI